jgi:hypothetical protein
MGLDLTRYDLVAQLHCRVALGRCLRGAASLEEAAQAACRHFYDELLGPGASGPSRACALVRCFKTHPYGLLEPDLQAAARELMQHRGPASPAMPCLTLLASIGDEPAWCSRHSSLRRRCLPLESPSAVERTPMWARFFRESGVDTAALCRPRAPEFVDRTPRSVDVFCVERAAGATSIPDQADFVSRYGIESVFGFCSQLRRGDVYVLVLFSRVAVARETAARMRPLALDLTSSFFGFAQDQVFARAAPPTLK